MFRSGACLCVLVCNPVGGKAFFDDESLVFSDDDEEPFVVVRLLLVLVVGLDVTVNA